MRMALGLAASQASGLIEQIGTMTHFVELGVAAANGLRAALWAQGGMTSIPDVLENPKGFCQFQAGKGGYNLEEMTRDLGKYYFVTEPGVSIKKYPCCYRTHRAIDATFELLRENNVTYEDVAEIRVDENLYDRQLLKYSEPVIGNDGRFSMEHCLAAVLVDGRVDEETFGDPKIRALKEARKKVKVIVHEEWPSERSAARTPVTLKLKSGKEYVKELDKPIDPTRDQIIERYKAGARSILTETEIEESAKKIIELEKVGNVRELMKLVKGRG
jgi:2-methylcitrate dehydratase PrpD